MVSLFVALVFPMLLGGCTEGPVSVRSDIEFESLSVARILQSDFPDADTIIADSAGYGRYWFRFYRAQAGSCVYGFTFFLTDTVADAYYPGFLVSVTPKGEIRGTMPVKSRSGAPVGTRDTILVNSNSRCGELFNGLSVWRALYVAPNEPCGSATVVQDTSVNAPHSEVPDRYTRTPARIAWVISRDVRGHLSALYRSRVISSCPE